MLTLLEWMVPAATIIAALMTASNLGARVTGWGFAVFAVSSVGWITVDVAEGNPSPSLLVAHCVLLIVNLFGVWRWLGRQSRYEDSSARASDHSRRARVPTLFSAESIIGATVRDSHGEKCATVIDAMLKCDDKQMAYVVISEGGVGGAGETLRAVPPEHLRFDEDDVLCDLSDDARRRLPPIEENRWPTTAPPAVR
jgi:hypothetical protein